MKKEELFDEPDRETELEMTNNIVSA